MYLIVHNTLHSAFFTK